MSVAEHKILGDVLLLIIVAFFGIALPFYSWIRARLPESGWNYGGNVSTSGLQLYDLLGLGGLLYVVIHIWKENGSYLGKTMPAVTVSSTLSGALLFLSLAVIIPALLFWRVRLREFFGLSWARPSQAFWIVPLFLVLVGGGVYLLQYIGWQSWVESLGGEAQSSIKMLAQTTDRKMIVALIVVSVISAPVAEEFIFRGYVYPVVKRFTERGFATLFSAAFFAVVHMNLMVLPILFLFGIMMVLVYEHTGSIWAPILCHMVFNGLMITDLLVLRFSEHGGLSLI